MTTSSNNNDQDDQCDSGESPQLARRPSRAKKPRSRSSTKGGAKKTNAVPATMENVGDNDDAAHRARRNNRQNRQGTRRNGSLRNALSLAGMTFILSIAIAGPAQKTVELVHILPAMLILLGVIGTSVVADVLAVAATAADEAPFHAMASDRVIGAKESVVIVRNSARVNSLFADVVGDVCGTISGALGATIALDVARLVPNVPSAVTATATLATVAALTVGGKAATKGFAMRNATSIVSVAGRGWHTIKRLKRR